MLVFNELFSCNSNSNSNPNILENAVYNITANKTVFVDTRSGEFQIRFPAIGSISEGNFIEFIDIGGNLEVEPVKILGLTLFRGRNIVTTQDLTYYPLNKSYTVYKFTFANSEIGWILEESPLVIANSTVPIIVAWENITNTPTTVNEYNISDVYTKSEIDELINNIGPQTISWVDITSKPNTISAFGIIDAYTKSEVDVLISNNIPQTISWVDITSKPNTISAFGIIDAYTKSEVDALISNNIPQSISWVDITSKPNTISAFGIIDAYTKSEVDALVETITGGGTTVAWNSVLYKPTTITGYASDAVSTSILNTAISSHTHSNYLPLAGGTLTGQLTTSQSIIGPLLVTNRISNGPPAGQATSPISIDFIYPNISIKATNITITAQTSSNYVFTQTSFTAPSIVATNITCTNLTVTNPKFLSVTYGNVSVSPDTLNIVDGCSAPSTQLTIGELQCSSIITSTKYIHTLTEYRVYGEKVVGPRKTGYAAATGTTSKVAFATYTSPTISSTYSQTQIQAMATALQTVSRQLAAIKNDLIGHGLLGA